MSDCMRAVGKIVTQMGPLFLCTHCPGGHCFKLYHHPFRSFRRWQRSGKHLSPKLHSGKELCSLPSMKVSNSCVKKCHKPYLVILVSETLPYCLWSTRRWVMELPFSGQQEVYLKSGSFSDAISFWRHFIFIYLFPQTFNSAVSPIYITACCIVFYQPNFVWVNVNPIKQSLCTY